MSCSVSGSTMGFMIGLLRLPDLNISSCSRRYTAFCPARLGHSGLTLLPLGPWQAVQTAALVAPASAEPAPAGAAVEATASGAAAAGSCAVAVAAAQSPVNRSTVVNFMENRLSIMILRAPWKAANCTLGSVQSARTPQ